jgi:hypothetical protein
MPITPKQIRFRNRDINQISSVYGNPGAF